jgi:c(7)-type cytochrome triheme protein
MPTDSEKRTARRPFAVAASLAAAAGFLFLIAQGRGASAVLKEAPAGFVRSTPAALTVARAQGAAVFSHATEQHAAQSCDSCHRRADNSPRPSLPGHKSCIDCHYPQFTTAGGGFCAGCHTDLGARNPPLKAFPGLRSFNVRFDHAQHSSGAARPAEGCNACHQPARRGVALSIPAGFAAHDNCYQCHTPGAPSAGRDISSCGACHAPGRYSRTPTGAPAYRVSFTHAAHGPRQGLGCASCHNLRAGAPQGRQVTSPAPTQHFGSARAQSCMTCHDNRRAFGGEDFRDCKRCHRGQTFRF